MLKKSLVTVGSNKSFLHYGLMLRFDWICIEKGNPQLKIDVNK